MFCLLWVLSVLSVLPDMHHMPRTGPLAYWSLDFRDVAPISQAVMAQPGFLRLSVLCFVYILFMFQVLLDG